MEVVGFKDKYINPDSKRWICLSPDSSKGRRCVTNMSTFHVEWSEDADATVLGRLTARNGSGSATGIDGEGNWLQQADISSITCNIFDLDSSTPDTATATPTVTVSSVILDTPVTTNVVWTKDTTGYNFIHDLSNSYFPTGDRRYRVEYKVTLTGGAVFWGIYEGTARPVRTS